MDDVEDLDLQHRPGLGLVDQVVQAAPGRLELLKLRRVHDFVELRRDQRVELRDARLDHRFGVLGVDDRPVEHLIGEVRDDVAREARRCCGSGRRDVVENLVEEADLFGL